MSKTNEYIDVEGDDLQVRLAAAQTQARAASRHRYWAAYKFPVRPNVLVDVEPISSMGIEMLVGIITGNVCEHETRSLGVFLFYDARETEPSRVEIYNLKRRRSYEGLPVYWIGEVEAPESLTLLSSLVRRTKIENVGVKLVEAISVHESPQVEELLTELTRSSPLVAVRGGAVFSLGRFGLNLALVEEVAGNGRENMRVRQQAITALGKSCSPGAFDALRRLLGVVKEHPLLESIICAIGRSRHPDAGEVLKSFIKRTYDPGLRRCAEQTLDRASGPKCRVKEVRRTGSARRYPRRDRCWRLW